MSWALLSGALSIAGSLLLAYPALRAAWAIVGARGQSDDPDPLVDFLETELGKVSVAWSGRLYWMLVAGFVALVLSGIATILEATGCPTLW